MRLVIDARESGTSTGRYIDKLIEYLYKLEPEFEVVVLAKSPRIDFIKQIAPDFKVMKSDYKEFSFGEQLGLAWQLYKLRADLVHFNAPQQPILYLKRSVTTVHDLTTVRFNNPAKNWLVFKLKQQIYKLVIRLVARKSKSIIAISNYVKEDLAKFAHINPAKITVIYEAADKITEPAKKLPALEGYKFLLYVGRPTPHKNLNRLVDAFLITVNQAPDLKLVLAGKTDANYEKLKTYVEQKNLTSQVIFTDFVSEAELRWLYENALLYVFPSLSEGFGLPALEAMAHGLPVAASNATCLPEVYGDGALYFDPHDVHDMTAKVLQIVGSQKMRDKLSANGKKVAAKYSWRQAAAQTLKIYQELLN